MKRLKLSELSLDCHCYDSPEQMYPEIADEDIVPARYRVVHGIDDNPDICALPPLPTGLALLSASTRFPAQVYHDMTRLSIADRLAGLSATKDDAKVLLPFQASLSRKLQECLISAYKHRTYGYYYRLADDTTIISRAEPISTSVQDMSIIGTSGSGKSSAVGMELMRYPKGILHKHQGFSYIQIPFLLAVAHRGTDIKSLYIDCARQIDGIIDSNSFYESQMIKLNTVPRMESFLVQLIQLFHIGAILIDEIQLVVNVRTKMFDHLLSITASCGVALVIIGTEHALKDQMKNEWFCRRFTHLGRICSDIPLTDSSTMCSIISQIWEMQWTKEKYTMNEGLMHTLMSESGNNIDFLTTIFLTAQYLIIKSEEEGKSIKMTEELIREAASRYPKSKELIISGKASLENSYLEEKANAWQGIRDDAEAHYKKQEAQVFQAAPAIITSRMARLKDIIGRIQMIDDFNERQIICAYEQAEQEVEDIDALEVRQIAKIVLTKLQAQAAKSKGKKGKSPDNEKVQERKTKTAKMSKDLNTVINSSKSAFELLQSPA